jgi:NSS family neurotransmitter:Na+ symporter
LEQKRVHETWSSPRAFLLAAIGSAVGLGNIWRFPYLAGESGGSAFVLVYVLSVALVAMPMLTAELVLGRRGGSSPVGTMSRLAREESRSPLWRYHGYLMLSIVVLGSSFFSVVSAWCLAYIPMSLLGEFKGADAAASSRLHADLLGAPVRMIAWHGVFMGLTVLIVAGGILKGLERAVKLLMPALFALLGLLVVYAAVIGDPGEGLRFLFTPDFSRLDAEAVLKALAQSLLSLSVGVGVMMTYGAYLPPGVSIPRGAAIIALVDTLVALLSGLAIFPIVFRYGLLPNEGPGLTFVTLPIAFGQMPGGALVGGSFFVLLVLASLTSSIGLLEVVVSWLSELVETPRVVLAIVAGAVVWGVGVAAALSFNVWSGFKPLARFPRFQNATIFGLVEYLSANILLPASVFLIAVFAGWMVSRRSTLEETGLHDGMLYRGWRFLVRYVAPAAVAIVAVYNLI